MLSKELERLVGRLLACLAAGVFLFVNGCGSGGSLPLVPVTGTQPLTAGAKGNILALAATEPYAQLPSRAVLKMPRPMQLEKVYLLTANLTKAVKCYFPGAEVVVHYADGEDQIVQLVPPYTMSNFGQIFCPTAFAIPFGTMQGDCTPLKMGGC